MAKLTLKQKRAGFGGKRAMHGHHAGKSAKKEHQRSRSLGYHYHRTQRGTVGHAHRGKKRQHAHAGSSGSVWPTILAGLGGLAAGGVGGYAAGRTAGGIGGIVQDIKTFFGGHNQVGAPADPNVVAGLAALNAPQLTMQPTQVLGPPDYSRVVQYGDIGPNNPFL